MKKLIFLFFLVLFGIGFGQVSKISGFDSLFSAVKRKDSIAVFKQVVSLTDFRDYILRIKNISDAPRNKIRELDSMLAPEFSSYRAHIKSQLEKLYRRAAQLKITWSNAILDSVKDGQFTDGTSYKQGKFYFSDKSSKMFYCINFSYIDTVNGKIFIETLLTPYIHYGPLNRMLTAGIKNDYIKYCTTKFKEAQKNSDRFGSKMIKDLLSGDPKNYCECQYISITDQTDGVERVKKKETGVPMLPPTKK